MKAGTFKGFYPAAVATNSALDAVDYSLYYSVSEETQRQNLLPNFHGESLPAKVSPMVIAEKSFLPALLDHQVCITSAATKAFRSYRSTRLTVSSTLALNAFS